MNYKKREDKIFFDIVEDFGDENKELLAHRLRSLLRAQRARFIKEIEKNLDKI